MQKSTFTNGNSQRANGYPANGRQTGNSAHQADGARDGSYGAGRPAGGAENYSQGAGAGVASQGRMPAMGGQSSGGERRRPVQEFRLGRIQGAVWLNQSENGPRYSVTINKSYKEGEVWKTTQSFSREDLLLVAKIADQAHTWIFAQARQDSSRSG